MTGSHDVVICGASFGGLITARQLAGSGADVLLLDRYEIGERQTSACVIPTSWLEELGLLEAEKQRFGTVVIHTAHGSLRLDVPWSFSTFDYRLLCDLLWQDCDATFETAKVNGRGERGPNGEIGVDTDRGLISAPLVVDAMGWKRVLAEGAVFQPPNAPLSRGLEVHPPGGNEDLEVWIDRKYVPAGYGWSFPADDEVRVGIGSFDPGFPVRPTTDQLAEDTGAGKSAYQGNWIPHQFRPATGGDVFFVGDSAGHCLPMTAEGIRPALYFGLALGMELRAVLEGSQNRDQALAAYRRFADEHEWKFRWMLRSQNLLPKLHPRLVKPILGSIFGPRASGHWAFNHYRDIAPPEFIRAAEARRPIAAPIPG